MRLLVFFTSYLLFLSSCSGGNPDAAQNENSADSLKFSIPAYNNSYEKGKLIPGIRCAKDSSLSYALYLPESYSADKKNPVIYFFDPHASGSLPLEKYRKLAEKYGYILAGSNNSKNGMSWEQNRPQVKMFMDDVKSRFNIDARRIYTCGFSGGSRVACSVAIFEGGVNCVIGMGAGLPGLNEPIHNRFDYIGFAGNKDFNMNEMKGLIASMDKSPIRHQLIIFDGKHEWAPVQNAEDAFIWLQVNAIKDALISPNDSLFKNFIAKNDSAIKAAVQKKDIYEELFLCKKRVNYLDGLLDVSEYKKKAEELGGSDAMKKIIVKNEELVKEELSRQQEYSNSFSLKDIAWWTLEIQKINRLSRDKNNEDIALMNMRLMSYLGLVAYMNAKSALEARQVDLLKKFLIIYEMVDPENSEHQYLYADMYAISKDSQKALSSLENAAKLGFNDVKRLQADTLLSALRNSPDYNSLLLNLSSKK